jgi:hypothetical protein
MVAVTSVSQALNARVVDRKNMAPMLKRAAVLCDQVFVDTTGVDLVGNRLESLVLNTIFGGRADGIDLLEDRRFRKLLLRVEDLSERPGEILEAIRHGPTDDALAEVAEEYALTVPDADIAELTRYRPDYKARGALMLELLEDLRRPLVLREWLPDPIGILGPMHRDVLGVSLRSAASPLDLLEELVPAAMFDFGYLSWSQVLELRSSTHVQDFRRLIRELESLPAATIRQRWHDDIETMAALGKPSLGKVLVSGFLGNLPISPLNPIAIGQSVGQAPMRGVAVGDPSSVG